MKFELIRSLQNLDEDFVSEMDIICPNDLDYGDVDYFDKEMCQLM